MKVLDTNGSSSRPSRSPDGIEVLQRADGVTVLVFSGELDITRTPPLQVTINEVLRARPAALVIDFCRVTFADSTVLALLLNARRRAAHNGIALALACAAPRTLQLLELTRLDREFEIYPSRRAAVSAVVSAVR